LVREETTVFVDEDPEEDAISPVNETALRPLLALDTGCLEDKLEPQAIEASLSGSSPGRDLEAKVNAGVQRRLPRPSSAPPRSRQVQHCANILEKGGTSALEQAFLLRELRAGANGPTPPTGASGKPRRGAWLSKKFEHGSDLAPVQPQGGSRQQQISAQGDEPPEGHVTPASTSPPRIVGQSLRPSSAGARPPPAAMRPSSAGPAKLARAPLRELLSQMNCNEHYLEQKLGISRLAPAVAPLEPVADSLELLYYGFSHENKGRHAYLKERHKLGPQEKHKNTMTGNQEVGWLLGDPHRPLRPPAQKCCKERPSMISIGGC